jgi:hypothetical protein
MEERTFLTQDANYVLSWWHGLAVRPTTKGEQHEHDTQSPAVHLRGGA